MVIFVGGKAFMTTEVMTPYVPETTLLDNALD